MTEKTSNATGIAVQTLNNRLDEILKNSLVGIYMDCPEIVDSLHRVDYSRVNFKFKNELFKRITPDEFKAVDDFLRSDSYKIYKVALDQAALACTQDLGELIYFVATANEGDLH
jgi:hypothetical protein